MAVFQLCSDLHLEMRGGVGAGVDAYPKRSAPILVLAGDLYPAGAPEFKEILRRASEPFELTLYVPGNHEYYGCKGSMQSMEKMVAEKVDSLNNVFCLNMRSINVGRVNFIGATMWSNPPKETWAFGAEAFNDYTSITEADGSPYTPEKLYSVHKRHSKFIERALQHAKKARGCRGAVVVTHHAPDKRLSMETASRPRELFPFYFATDMKSVTEDPFVKVWCHGHSHESHCIRLDPWGPIFACNARGYPSERTGYTNTACVSLDF